MNIAPSSCSVTWTPSRPSMVALVGAEGAFHLAQDGVHLGDAELLVGAHGGMAGEGGEQLVATFGEGAAGAEIAQFVQYLGRWISHFSLRYGLECHQYFAGSFVPSNVSARPRLS